MILSTIDKLIVQFDRGLRTLNGIIETTERQNPAADIEDAPLTEKECKHSAGLMRVNHVGEICAQALYEGQALTAKSEQVKEKMQHAAMEENDHLQWCEDRLKELSSRTSYLNPFWYVSSFAMGAIAGAIGDKWSLGFVVETEHQVEEHLNGHLDELPKNDNKSRAIVEQMKADEIKHANMAQESGAANLPDVVKKLMRIKAKVMTSSAYWL